MVRILGKEKSMVKTYTTDILDYMEESKRPWVRRLAENIGLIVPNDWGNFFSDPQSRGPIMRRMTR